LVISEGIANTGIEVLFSPREIVTIGLEEICPIPEKEYPIDALITDYNVRKARLALASNLAFHTHVDGWSDEKLVKYGSNFEIYTLKNIKKILQFIHHPIASTYAFNYYIGEMLIKKKYGERPSPSDFEQLLTNQFLPSDLI